MKPSKFLTTIATVGFLFGGAVLPAFATETTPDPSQTTTTATEVTTTDTPAATTDPSTPASDPTTSTTENTTTATEPSTDTNATATENNSTTTDTPTTATENTAPATETGTPEIVDPGILPDSPLYFLDKLLDEINVALTFDDQEKAKVLLEQAKERFAEASTLSETDKVALAQEALDLYAEKLEAAKAQIDKVTTAEPTTETEKLESELVKTTTNNIVVLQRILPKLPEKAQLAIARNIERAQQKALAKAAKKAAKQAVADIAYATDVNASQEELNEEKTVADKAYGAVPKATSTKAAIKAQKAEEKAEVKVIKAETKAQVKAVKDEAKAKIAEIKATAKTEKESPKVEVKNTSDKSDEEVTIEAQDKDIKEKNSESKGKSQKAKGPDKRD